jgi:hypothetical protein
VDLEEGKSNLESSRDQSNGNKTNKPEQGDENDQNKKPLAFYLYKNFCLCLIIMSVLFLLAVALATVLGVVLAALSLKTNSDESLANSIECPSLQYYNKYQLSGFSWFSKLACSIVSSQKHMIGTFSSLILQPIPILILLSSSSIKKLKS